MLSKIAKAKTQKVVFARSFQWQKATFLFTPKSTISMFKTWESQINQISSKCGSIEAISPIDWASWENEIKSPGVVAKLKSEYENMKFAATDLEFLEEFKVKVDQMIKEAESGEIPNTVALQEELSKSLWIRDNWNDLEKEEKYQLMPESLDYLEDNLWQGSVDLEPEEEELDDFYDDISTVRQKFLRGEEYPFPEDKKQYVSEVAEKYFPSFGIKAEPKESDNAHHH